MQYVVYFLVATPLVLGWLFWEADRPLPPPLFQSGIEAVQNRAVPPEPAPAPKRLARDTSAPRNE